MKTLNAICLITPDVRRLREFYEQVLRVPAQGDDHYTWFTLRGVGMSIYADPAMRAMAPAYLTETGKGDVTFEFEVEDVDREYTRLLDLGAPIVKPPTTQPWGIRSVWFRDPAGNIVNFLAPVAGGPKSAESAVREYVHRVLNEKDLAACDELLAGDYVDHDGPAGSPPGPQPVKEYLAGFFAEVPDLRVEIEDLIAEGGKVAARLSWSGHHTQSGEPYRRSGIVFLRLDENNKLVERWSAYSL